MSNRYHSDFWLSDYYNDWDFIDDQSVDTTNDDDSTNNSDIETPHSELTKKLIKLSSARRAVANYVSILTGKNIPVSFNDDNVNCTDGKSIYLSADLTKKNKFDVSVGLALHEGSHILYSDFDLFKTIWMKVPRSIYKLTEKLGISKTTVGEVCTRLYNYVEDRYIDYMVHNKAPGYRGYYDALYDCYFNSKAISDAIKSDLYKTPSVESYMFRIVNLTNPNTNLRALPGLYDVAKILDLSNIVRLSTPENRLDVTFKIAEVVFTHITLAHSSDKNLMSLNGSTNQPSSDIQKENSVDNNNVGIKDTTSDKNNTSPNDVDEMIGGSETSASTVDGDKLIEDIGDDKNIKPTKLNNIKKAFAKQKNFLSGNLKKKKVSKKEKHFLDVLEKSRVELMDVAHEYTKRYNIASGIECIFVKNMTKELLMSSECPMYIGNDNNRTYQHNLNNVNIGIVMGTKLGRRLQIRNEVNNYKFSRRCIGKLDKRLIHELGFSDENVFYTTLTEKYKKIHFHISVDASSSMTGEKWDKSIRLCVAIAKAATMLDNIHLTISFRSTLGKNPYILIGYDSSVDKFSKIRNLFPYLASTSVTPEGLCYEALLKHLSPSSNDVNSYFINISDGQPFFDCLIDGTSIYYADMPAAEHTRNQIKKIRNVGYKVISYFVHDVVVDPKSKALFNTMYGEDSCYINVDNITQIANTLNKKMMESLDI